MLAHCSVARFRLGPIMFVLLGTFPLVCLAQGDLPDLGTSPQVDALTVNAGPGGLTLGASFARQKFIITPQYSNETGASLGVTLASMLGEDAAVGVLLNVGADKKEWLINAGYKLDERQRFIVTAGQLKQFLDYAFVSGTEKVGMTQNSGALSYQLQLGKEFLRFLEVNGYVAKTDSRDLADKTFAVDSTTLFELWNDPRRIAGGQVAGVQGKLGFSPIEGSTVKVSFGQERLSYDLFAGKDSTHRLTGGLEWLQQLPNRLLLKFSADTYASQNRYSIGLNRSLNGADGGRHSLGFAIDRIRGRDGLGNDTQYKLIYSYAFGTGNRAGGTSPSAATAQATPLNTMTPNGILSTSDQIATAMDSNLLNQVAQRPSFIPSHVVAKIDKTALPTRLVAIDQTTLPAGTTVDATGDITTPLGAIIASMAGVTRNGAPFTNSGQFILSGNNLITRPSQIVQPAAGVTDTYIVTFNNQGGGTTLATVVVSHGSVKIDSIIVNHSATPAAPIVTADDTLNTVGGMVSGLEYKLDTAGYVLYNAATFNALDLSGSHSLLVRVAASGATPAGLVTTLNFTPNPAQPAAPIVTADDTLNTVGGMVSGLEYKLDTAGYVLYNAAIFNALDLSGTHSLLVRVAASGATPAGLVTTLNFTTNSPPITDTPSTVTAPTAVWTSTTLTETNTISDADGLRNVTYYLYQNDGTTLFASNTTGATFTGLLPSTPYKMKTTAETYNPVTSVWTLQTSPLSAITTQAPANIPPVVTKTADFATTNGTVVADKTLTVNDANNDPQTLMLTATGHISVISTSPAAGSVTGNGTANVTVSNLPAGALLTYSYTAPSTGTSDTITEAADDGRGGTHSVTTTVTLTDGPAPPGPW